MEIIKRICEAEVKEFYKEDLVKTYNNFFFSKEEAVKFCTDVVKRRLKEIKELECVTPGSLMQFMNDEEYQFKLCVSERSARKKIYEESDAYAEDFHKFIKEKSECLYDQLLTTVISNNFLYDYFGNEMCVYTDSESFVEFWEGEFTEENCKDGIFRGNFQYYKPLKKVTNRAFTINERFYYMNSWAGKEQVKDIDGERDTYIVYAGMEGVLEDAVTYACGNLLGEMGHYVESDDEYYPDLSDEQEYEVFKEKVKDYSVKISVISSKHIQFESQKELAAYYAEQVAGDELDEENIYDFLLSLVKCEERYYDIHGNYFRSRIVRQELDGTTEYDIVPDFSIETAKRVLEYQKKRKDKMNGNK